MKKIALAVIILGNGAILAQAGEHKFEVGAGVFDSIPAFGDFKNDAKSSPGAAVYADYTVLDRTDDLFTVGLEAGEAAGYESKDDSSVDYLCTTIGLRGRLLKKMDFGSRKGRVYAVVGIAAYRWRTDPHSGLDTTSIGFNFGPGLDVELSDHWLAGAEFRYHMPNKSGSFAYSLAPTLKVGYSF